MAEWGTMSVHQPLDSVVQILPWIPPQRKSASASELAFVIALSVLFVAAAVIASERRRIAIWRWSLVRHRVFRAPFYRIFGAGWAGLPGSARG